MARTEECEIFHTHREYREGMQNANNFFKLCIINILNQYNVQHVFDTTHIYLLFVNCETFVIAYNLWSS